MFTDMSRDVTSCVRMMTCDQMLILIESLPTVLLGIVAFFIMPDRPATSKYLVSLPIYTSIYNHIYT